MSGEAARRKKRTCNAIMKGGSLKGIRGGETGAAGEGVEKLGIIFTFVVEGRKQRGEGGSTGRTAVQGSCETIWGPGPVFRKKSVKGQATLRVQRLRVCSKGTVSFSPHFHLGKKTLQYLKTWTLQREWTMGGVKTLKDGGEGKSAIYAPARRWGKKREKQGRDGRRGKKLHHGRGRHPSFWANLPGEIRGHLPNNGKE